MGFPPADQDRYNKGAYLTPFSIDVLNGQIPAFNNAGPHERFPALIALQTASINRIIGRIGWLYAELSGLVRPDKTPELWDAAKVLWHAANEGLRKVDTLRSSPDAPTRRKRMRGKWAQFQARQLDELLSAAIRQAGATKGRNLSLTADVTLLVAEMLRGALWDRLSVKMLDERSVLLTRLIRRLTPLFRSVPTRAGPDSSDR